jgi:hypothetical protein
MHVRANETSLVARQSHDESEEVLIEMESVPWLIPSNRYITFTLLRHKRQ